MAVGTLNFFEIPVPREDKIRLTILLWSQTRALQYCTCDSNLYPGLSCRNSISLDPCDADVENP